MAYYPPDSGVDGLETTKQRIETVYEKYFNLKQQHLRQQETFQSTQPPTDYEHQHILEEPYEEPQVDTSFDANKSIEEERREFSDSILEIIQIEQRRAARKRNDGRKSMELLDTILFYLPSLPVFILRVLLRQGYSNSKPKRWNLLPVNLSNKEVTYWIIAGVIGHFLKKFNNWKWIGIFFNPIYLLLASFSKSRFSVGLIYSTLYFVVNIAVLRIAGSLNSKR
eukprot:TRINITY_DN27105_c0_g1_i1.p1 TRINITY_DN27105_c0_g1~~TRINITY_DN27105_c0_g1_i1.p1  ORF type:complete len:224 (-),score=24.02 TRINITY_DN27105_c0_g1_i1:18-689(-)